MKIMQDILYLILKFHLSFFVRCLLNRKAPIMKTIQDIFSLILKFSLFFLFLPRCLLNKKAAPIMKIIQDIFCLILKFCSQLSSAAWGQDSSTGEVTHPNFAAMATSYKAFREYFIFLFKGMLTQK